MMQKSQMRTVLKKILPSLILFKITTAYLEPGSSSFLLKILVSGLVGFVVFFRQIWSYVRAVWGKLSGKQRESVEMETAVTDPPPQNEIQ